MAGEKPAIGALKREYFFLIKNFGSNKKYGF